MAASELLRPHHGVDEVDEGGNTQQQRQQSHDITYTRSHSVTKPSIAANAANPRTIIPIASIAELPSADRRRHNC
jgi:hypothetical protein